ncbi:MAG: TIGR04255 family protein [Armatimonadetes bacterium]|nr:TIGR04255 family protein [Armatimonadota bacterium]
MGSEWLDYERPIVRVVRLEAHIEEARAWNVAVYGQVLERLNNRWGGTLAVTGQQVTVSLTPPSAETTAGLRVDIRAGMKSADGKWTALVGQSAVALEYHRDSDEEEYRGWKECLERLKDVLEVSSEVSGGQRFGRVVLSYVNELPFSDIAELGQWVDVEVGGTPARVGGPSNFIVGWREQHEAGTLQVVLEGTGVQGRGIQLSFTLTGKRMTGGGIDAVQEEAKMAHEAISRRFHPPEGLARPKLVEYMRPGRVAA